MKDLYSFFTVEDIKDRERLNNFHIEADRGDRSTSVEGRGGGSRIGVREKLGCCAAATKASANPRGSWEAGVDFQCRLELWQGYKAFIPRISQSLDAGSPGKRM